MMTRHLQIPRTIFNVTQITQTLSRLIDQSEPLQDVWVRGQISNLSMPTSGHIYFTLKDTKSTLRSVVFRRYVARLQFQPVDGEEVLVHGKIDIYAAASEYQIVVRQIEPLGIGALHRAFEALKQQLAAEGLFDKQHKKPLPTYPRKIGVITSETGAAIQDILQQLQKRFPLAELLLYPTHVQGDLAAPQIVTAIQRVNTRRDIDVLIIGRGGGSMEDLMPFNQETVARAIFASTIPIISAVGHETDFTISDMVADHRSPTPSAAIAHLVPDKQEIMTHLQTQQARITSLALQQVETHRKTLDIFAAALSPAKRTDALNALHQTVDTLEATCRKAMRERLEREHMQLQTLADRLHGLSPLATLQRGYSITRTATGEIITSHRQTHIGAKLNINLAEGGVICTVDEQVESV